MRRLMPKHAALERSRNPRWQKNYQQGPQCRDRTMWRSCECIALRNTHLTRCRHDHTSLLWLPPFPCYVSGGLRYSLLIVPGQSSATLEGEWLFKATLVLLTTKIVEIARDASGQLMELVVPLIEESLRMPAKAVFEEDGMALSVLPSV